jgi:hypothetical protein
MKSTIDAVKFSNTIQLSPFYAVLSVEFFINVKKGSASSFATNSFGTFQNERS